MANPTFTRQPLGPFDLINQNKFFGGWDTMENENSTIIMVFPVENWKGSAAVTLKQLPNGIIEGMVFGDSEYFEPAKQQALAALSLDIDATAWPEVGTRDPFIGSLQEKYHFLRPELFHSPYEAAAHFIIGHRISSQQARNIRKKMAESHGEKITVNGKNYSAFPLPQTLLNISEYPGLNEVKVTRLHAVAQAALSGLLNRAYLRSLSVEQALLEIESLPGVGPFFSQGILHRGAGLVDKVTDDDVSKHGIRKAYDLGEKVSFTEVQQLAEKWRPFRMWATVLIHVWVRREVGMPEKRTYTKQAKS